MADSQKHVLIVEDEKPLAHALELKLQNVGWQTTVARDGKQAVDLIKDTQYDVMLMDLMMPEMDGFQVLTELKGKPHRPPVIFVLSNLNQPEDEQRVMDLGAQKFLVKANTPLATIVDMINNA